MSGRQAALSHRVACEVFGPSRLVARSEARSSESVDRAIDVVLRIGDAAARRSSAWRLGTELLITRGVTEAVKRVRL